MSENNNLTEIEKAVIMLDFDPRERYLIKSRDSYEFSERVINKILVKHNVTTDRVFIGGSKHHLQLYISSLIDIFYMKDMDSFLDESMQFDFDPDFDVPTAAEVEPDQL